MIYKTQNKLSFQSNLIETKKCKFIIMILASSNKTDIAFNFFLQTGFSLN